MRTFLTQPISYSWYSYSSCTYTILKTCYLIQNCHFYMLSRFMISPRGISSVAVLPLSNLSSCWNSTTKGFCWLTKYFLARFAISKVFSSFWLFPLFANLGKRHQQDDLKLWTLFRMGKKKLDERWLMFARMPNEKLQHKIPVLQHSLSFVFYWILGYFWEIRKCTEQLYYNLILFTFIFLLDIAL